MSRLGNPFGFEHEHRFLTRSALFFYMRYAYAAEHVNFKVVDTVVELGAGAGKQAEVLKRLHPHLTIVLLDLAPSLYVAERFLTTAYPDQTIPYRETCEPGCALVPGHIHFFGNFRIDDIAPLGNTLFWSAATLEEMEPAAVAHYRRAVTTFAESLYLHGCFDRAPLGSGSDFDPTPLAAYVDAFPEHELVDRRIAHTGLAELIDRVGHYDDTLLGPALGLTVPARSRERTRRRASVAVVADLDEVLVRVEAVEAGGDAVRAVLLARSLHVADRVERVAVGDARVLDA